MPAQLADVWSGEETTAHLLHAALSAKAGNPLPWTLVRQALEEGFRLGLFERSLQSGRPWPCDVGGASAVKIRISESGAKELPGRAHGARVATAELAGKVGQEVVDQVNGILSKVKSGWKIN